MSIGSKSAWLARVKIDCSSVFNSGNCQRNIARRAWLYFINAARCLKNCLLCSRTLGNLKLIVLGLGCYHEWRQISDSSWKFAWIHSHDEKNEGFILFIKIKEGPQLSVWLKNLRCSPTIYSPDSKKFRCIGPNYFLILRKTSPFAMMIW